MKKGMCVCLSGPGADEAARWLTVNLIKKRRSAEFIDMKAIKRFGTAKIAADVCGLLARNGTIVVLTHPKVNPPQNKLVYGIKPNSSPNDTADDIMKQLVGLGCIAKDAPDVAPEDDERIWEQLESRNLIG